MSDAARAFFAAELSLSVKTVSTYRSRILEKMHRRTNAELMRRRMRSTPAHGNLRAKSGTMSNIRSLAGYVTAANGEPLAFVIMLNNFEGPSAEANRAIDAIAITLAEFSR